MTATGSSASRRRSKRNGPSSASPKRICVLTGGGDAPGLNAVLRALVKTCYGLGIEVFGSEDGFEGLIQPHRMVKMDPSTVRGILPRGGSILGCSNRANPFAYPTRDAKGKERYIDVSDKVVERLHRHEIDILVMIGGDGTMTHGKRMQELGIPVVGVPKTIDNDLAATDYTFGFDTAVHTATWAIDALHSTAEAHDRIMILELMGRDAGWIALSAGVAGGADVILIPEIPYDIQRVAAKIRQRAERGATFSIVVIGEGAKPVGGEASTVAPGHEGHLPRLGGAGHALGEHLEALTAPTEVRVTVLGHLQRGGSPSSFDRLLGTRFGEKAAHLCAAGKTGRMVALRGTEIVDVAIEEALQDLSRVPVPGQLVRTARAIGIELGAAVPGIDPA